MSPTWHPPLLKSHSFSEACLSNHDNMHTILGSADKKRSMLFRLLAHLHIQVRLSQQYSCHSLLFSFILQYSQKAYHNTRISRSVVMFSKVLPSVSFWRRGLSDLFMSGRIFPCEVYFLLIYRVNFFLFHMKYGLV